MEISPSKKRDYEEILKKCIIDVRKLGFNFSMEALNEFVNLNCTYNKLDAVNNSNIVKILDCSIGLLIKQYEEMVNVYKNDTNKYNHKIINFYKVIIYDHIDLRNAICTFIGIQLQGIIRSIIEHTKMYLLCIFDDNFQEYYFSEYTKEEKKKRYYEKKGTNIDKKLEKIYMDAIENKKTESTDSLLRAINSEDLYKRIHNHFSELTHLSEFTIANEILNDSLDLSFKADNTWKYEKYYDDIIEYIIVTIIIIFIKNNEKMNLQYDKDTKAIYNLLVSIYNELFKFRNIDNLLVELTKQVEKIYNE